MGGDVDLTGYTVLLVEDEMLIRMDVEDALTGLGAKVVSTGRLGEALDLADGDITHAVLDVKLEDGSVHPVARRLSELGVPFTFYSCAARCEGLEEGFPGAVVLQKPVMPEELAAAIAGTDRQGRAA